MTQELVDRLDAVLDAIREHGEVLEPGDPERAELLSIYQDLLDERKETGFTEQDSYFFTVPGYPAYEPLLDEALKDFLLFATAFTLPDSTECRRTDIDTLQEQLDNLK